MCSTLGFFLIQGLQSDRVLSESSLYSPLNRLTLAAPSFTLNTWYFFGPYIMAFIHSSQITAPCLPLQIHCITLVYNCSQLPTTKPFPHVPCPTFLIGKFFIILQFRLRPFLNPSGSSACFTCLFAKRHLHSGSRQGKKLCTISLLQLTCICCHNAYAKIYTYEHLQNLSDTPTGYQVVYLLFNLTSW